MGDTPYNAAEVERLDQLIHDMNGERLYEAVADVAARSEQMGEAARKLSKPGAARRAADLLEEMIDRPA